MSVLLCSWIIFKTNYFDPMIRKQLVWHFAWVLFQIIIILIYILLPYIHSVLSLHVWYVVWYGMAVFLTWKYGMVWSDCTLSLFQCIRKASEEPIAFFEHDGQSIGVDSNNLPTCFLKSLIDVKTFLQCEHNSAREGGATLCWTGFLWSARWL